MDNIFKTRGVTAITLLTVISITLIGIVNAANILYSATQSGSQNIGDIQGIFKNCELPQTAKNATGTYTLPYALNVTTVIPSTKLQLRISSDSLATLIGSYYNYLKLRIYCKETSTYSNQLNMTTTLPILFNLTTAQTYHFDYYFDWYTKPSTATVSFSLDIKVLQD